MTKPILSGLRIVSIALNLPGPIATQALVKMGFGVTKIEPPGGDPFAGYDRDWYGQLASGHQVVRIDLKTDQGLKRLDEALQSADVFLSSQRPSALQRLHLCANQLRPRFPNLCVVNIVGETGARAEIAGHDLTYQAHQGLLNPPHMPRTLLADIAGAQRAVQVCLALVLAREMGNGAGAAEVGLADAAAEFATPWHRGATHAGAILGGGHAGYRMYQASDGWVAVAALEPHFFARMSKALGIEDGDVSALEARFAQRTAGEWEQWAREQDVPLAALPPDLP